MLATKLNVKQVNDAVDLIFQEELKSLKDLVSIDSRCGQAGEKQAQEFVKSLFDSLDMKTEFWLENLENIKNLKG